MKILNCLRFRKINLFLKTLGNNKEYYLYIIVDTITLWSIIFYKEFDMSLYYFFILIY